MAKRGGTESGPGAETPAHLFREAPIGYLLVDVDGRIVRVNRRGAEVLQCPIAELVGRALSDFGLDAPLARAMALTKAQHGPSWDPLYRDNVQILLPDGELRRIRVTVDPVFDSAGRAMSARMLVEDTSEEVADAAALHRASVRFRFAFDHAPVGMHLSTPEGWFREVNGALCRMFGYSEEQLLTMQVWDLVHPDDLDAFGPARAALFAVEPGPFRVDSRFVTSDGSVRWCRLEAIMPNGPEGYLVSQVTDITDLVAAQQRLQALLESKNKFVATVSHELRTPLAGVVGFASELRDRAAEFTPAEVVEFAGLIAQASIAASNLVEDLLVAARLESGDIDLRPQITDLHSHAAIVKADPEIASRTEGKLVTIEGPPTVAWADPNRVHQILRNLMGNAGRYGGNRITIVVGTEPKTHKASIRVVDDGPGVPEDLHKALFQAYQHGAQESGRTESVGIGLYVSRNLARLMGGDLTCRRQDGATIFELTLPLPLPDQATDQGA
jgi:PAS domain S-box-containing protein